MNFDIIIRSDVIEIKMCIARFLSCFIFLIVSPSGLLETRQHMLLYVHSSIAIILMGKRELVALLNLSSWCLVMVERLFLALPRGCLRFVIVVFPDHTHLLFLSYHLKGIVCIQGYPTRFICRVPGPQIKVRN